MEATQTEVSTTQPKLNSDFWKYWAGQTISNMGSSITLFALPLLVYNLTGSALNLGLSTAANFLPYLLFGLILGAWTDRVDRKRMMILTDLGRAMTIATIPLLFWIGWLPVWWIYLVGFMHSTLTICFESGQFAAIPSLVKQGDLVTANGRIQASYGAASILGPVLAGALVAFMPIESLTLWDALTFVLSAISLLLIKRSFNAEGKARSQQGILHDTWEGLRYVLRHPVLRNISLMMALVNMVNIAATAQLVLFAKERLQASDSQVALIYSVGSLGIVVISLLAGPLRKRWSFSKVALGALMIDGLAQIVMAFTQWYWLALILFGLFMGLGMLFNINTASLRQTIVPNHMLGRIMSIAAVLATSAVPLGAIIGGAVLEQTHNVVLLYASSGVLYLLIPFCFAFTALGRAEKYLPQKSAEE